MSKSRIWKPITGVVVSVIVLSLVLLAFSLTLDWPHSLLTLGVTLVVAWFIGAGVGGKISKSSWAVIAASVLVVGLAAGSLVWGVPWKVGFAPAQQEKGSFIYLASFTYRGSASNLPIDNVYIDFPCPNVDNSTDSLQQTLTLTLFWHDADNAIHPEIVMRGDGLIFQVFEYHGAREENLKVLNVGITSSPNGPKLFYRVDRLYPSEGVWVNDNVTAPGELAGRVTLKEVEENNRTSANYQQIPAKVEFIDLSFWVELKRKIGDAYVSIEAFSRTYDNGASSGYWLYPN